jgi:hypothetical protein
LTIKQLAIIQFWYVVITCQYLNILTCLVLYGLISYSRFPPTSTLDKILWQKHHQRVGFKLKIPFHQEKINISITPMENMLEGEEPLSIFHVFYFKNLFCKWLWFPIYNCFVHLQRLTTSPILWKDCNL